MRRFIAGAICPSCGETDTLFVELQNADGQEKRVRACTRCAFSETLSEALEPSAPDSRDVVRIITPGNPPQKPS